MHGRAKIRRHRTHRSTKRLIRGHEADLCELAAGVGVLATGVLAYNAGKTASMQDFSDLSTEERICAYIRILAPTVAVSTATITAICLSGHFRRKRERALLETCAILASNIDRQGKIDEKDNRPARRESESDIEDTGTGDIIFTEVFTGRKFKASMEVYEYATRKLQENFSVCGIAILNDLYGLLNLEETCAGEILAWTSDQMVLDPDYELGDDFTYDEALTTLAIQLKKIGKNEYEIHYNIMPVGSLAGIGPCNY